MLTRHVPTVPAHDLCSAPAVTAHMRRCALLLVTCSSLTLKPGCCCCCCLACRAVEAVGLAPKGQGGTYVEQQYKHLLGSLEQQQQHRHHPATSSCSISPVWPVNTHGGLLGFGAPWEVPAMISLVEAVTQLRGEATGRQVEGARRALVYGNGGIFSASAVALLEGHGFARTSKL